MFFCLTTCHKMILQHPVTHHLLENVTGSTVLRATRPTINLFKSHLSCNRKLLLCNANINLNKICLKMKRDVMWNNFLKGVTFRNFKGGCVPCKTV
jgi:hypothetical protein